MTFLYTNSISFANYLNGIAQQNAITPNEVTEIIQRLDPKIKNIFLSQSLELPESGGISSQLKGMIVHHNTAEISRLVQKIAVEQDIQREMAKTHHITTKLQDEVRQARQQKGAPSAVTTTNPIQFLSDQRELAPYLPKQGKIIGVFKSKFGTNLTGPIIRELFTKLNEHRLGKITDLELKEALDRSVPFQSYKEGEKEELLEALKKAFIEDIDQASIDAMELWKQSTTQAELKTKHLITRAFKPLEDRFINTALLATLYDNICGTHLFPPAAPISVPGKGNGFIQESMVFLPLLKSVNEERAGLRLEALSHFIDLENYQEAVVRATEMADADLHAGNVALIPKAEDKVLSAFTAFKTEEMIQLLNALHQYRNLGSVPEEGVLRRLVADTHAEKLIAALGIAGLKEAFNYLKDNLHFEIKLYDVDLTMPKSNYRGVTGGKISVRDMLLALPLANMPLTDGVKSEIKRRKEHLEPIEQFISTHFNEQEHMAWKARILRINNAIKEEEMTARGLVWRAIPLFGEVEEYIDQLAVRYEKIKKQADRSPQGERKKRLKELEIEEFRYPALAQEAKNRNQLREEKEWFYNFDLIGFQNASDGLVDFMEKEKTAGLFQPTGLFPIKY